MPKPVAVDHSNAIIGPFTVLERAARSRYWKLRCPLNHVSERRIDHLLRLRPESVKCAECQRRKRKPAKAKDTILETFQRFLSTLQPESLGMLWDLLQALRTCSVSVK